MAARLSIRTINGRLARAHQPSDVRLHLALPKRLLGAVIVIAVCLLALLAPQIVPGDPSRIDARARLEAPSLEHPFGTDAFGRDLFRRVVHGAQPSLGVSVFAVVLGAVPGILLGMFAGRTGRWIDHLMTQVMDAWIALPGVLLALLLAAVLGRPLVVLTLALGIGTIPMFFRVARTETLRIRSELYVEAAVSLGADSWRITRAHVLPNIASSMIVLCTVMIGRMLLATSALSFIGLGAPPPSPEWGGLLAEGRAHMHEAW
ncbi:MAG: ABC transporter permease, partial [Anaerolineae bacterium]|nr:ABC transporter permease [Anaerolineae bacterium]